MFRAVDTNPRVARDLRVGKAVARSAADRLELYASGYPFSTARYSASAWSVRSPRHGQELGEVGHEYARHQLPRGPRDRYGLVAEADFFVRRTRD